MLEEEQSLLMVCPKDLLFFLALLIFLSQTEMGLGKTLQCITLIWTLMKQGAKGVPSIRRTVVVTPSSLAKNWKREFVKWLSPTRLDPYCIGEGTKTEVSNLGILHFHPHFSLFFFFFFFFFVGLDL